MHFLPQLKACRWMAASGESGQRGGRRAERGLGSQQCGSGSEKGLCVGDREGTFRTDETNQERSTSSEATGLQLAGSVRGPGGSVLLDFEPEPPLWHLDIGGSAFLRQLPMPSFLVSAHTWPRLLQSQIPARSPLWGPSLPPSPLQPVLLGRLLTPQ